MHIFGLQLHRAPFILGYLTYLLWIIVLPHGDCAITAKMHAVCVCMYCRALQPHLESCYLCLHSNRVTAHSPGCSRSVSCTYSSQAEQITELKKVSGEARKSRIKAEEDEEIAQALWQLYSLPVPAHVHVLLLTNKPSLKDMKKIAV